MSALAEPRMATPTLPSHPYVLLGGSERLTEGPFHIITQNLMSLGSCALEDLARSPKADLHGFDLPGSSGSASAEPDVPSASSQPPPDAGLAGCNGKEKPSDPMQFVAQLHQTCMQAFGNSDALKFEFLEEDGPDRKFCGFDGFDLPFVLHTWIAFRESVHFHDARILRLHSISKALVLVLSSHVSSWCL